MKDRSRQKQTRTTQLKDISRTPAFIAEHRVTMHTPLNCRKDKHAAAESCNTEFRSPDPAFLHEKRSLLAGSHQMLVFVMYYRPEVPSLA